MAKKMCPRLRDHVICLLVATNSRNHGTIFLTISVQELGLGSRWLPRERDRGPQLQVLRHRGKRFHRRAACQTVAQGVGQDVFQKKKHLIRRVQC